MKKFFFFIFILGQTSTFCEDKTIFPYVYTPEVLEKNWLKVRVEGQDSSYLKNPLRFIGYSIKAFKKKFTGPVELVGYFEKTEKIFNELNNELAVKNIKSDEVTLSLVGDLMWLRTGWSNFLDGKLKGHLESRDFLFGNLETLISKSHDVPTFPPARATFNSPESIVDEFRGHDGKSLFSALSVANNHSLDYGELGLEETLEVLKERSIPFSGLKDSKYPSSKKRWVAVENNGLKIGFYAATYGMNNRWEEDSDVSFNLIKGVAPHDPDSKVELGEIENAIQQMIKEKVDIKIISLHWGFEYEYYPEPKQIIVARNIVKLGADIIMGHHSHSQQPIDICFVNNKGTQLTTNKFKGACHLKSSGSARKSLIVYGLGNFLTNMYGFLSEVGTVLDVSFFKNSEGRWDWKTPKVHLVYNERDFREGKGEKPRRLLFMDDYLAKNCFKNHCSKGDLKDLDFIKELYPTSVFATNLP